LNIVRAFFEGSVQLSLLSIIIPYIILGGEHLYPEQVFSGSIILSTYRIYGNYCFSMGLKTFTQGRVVFRRIKELLMTKDLEMLQQYTETTQ